MKVFRVLPLLVAFIPGVVLMPGQAEAAYLFEKIYEGTEADKMNIIWIPSGYTEQQRQSYLDRVNYYSGKMWNVNWFGDHREYFDVYVLVDEDGNEPESIWDSDGQAKTTAELTALIAHLPHDWGSCNFISDQTCKNFPSVMIDEDPVAGGATNGYFYIGRTAGDYEYAHEYGHAGISYVLCDEYDIPAVHCRGSDRCRNLDDVPSNRKWSGFISGAPYEGGGHCTDDIWRPTEESIMRNTNNPVFDPLSYHAMNLGLEKRYGITEHAAPSISCDLAPGEEVSGRRIVTCTAQDASGIEMVEFFLAKAGESHRSFGISWAPPYSAEMDAASREPGQYYLRVIAWDNKWNWGQHNPPFVITETGDAPPIAPQGLHVY